MNGHNPYFNRWFSAIQANMLCLCYQQVTILILIDGFLQLGYGLAYPEDYVESQSLF